MLTPVTCQTCGIPVGDVEDLFRVMRAALAHAMLEKQGTTPTQAAADPGLQIACGEIFDRLEIRGDCCRKTLNTAMIFSDHY